MGQTTSFVVVTTTIDNKAKAEKIARQILRERLAACVQSVPVHSTYWWKGSVECACEFLLTAKTRASLADKLVAFIRKIHPYEVPEIVILPVRGGLKEYLKWIAAETKGSGKR